MKFTILLFAMFSTPLFAETWLVESGEPQAEIVISEKPTRSARLGATELQTYIEKISGARLEIVSEPTKQRPVSLFVGESELARQAGVKTDDLARDAYRIVSGSNWLALVGNDLDFQPKEPWARNHGDWAKNRLSTWEELAGHPWMCPVGSSLYRDYSRQLDVWTYDHRGSLNAVYAFLRDLGVRWYMPGELGEIVRESPSIPLPEVDRTVEPEYEVRAISRPLLSSNELEDSLWYLRIGANAEYGILHHGQRHLTEHLEQRATHPEYYAQMANGERDTQSETANACLSSEGFFNEMVAFARLNFDHYDIPVISVMPHDGFTHCQCDRCRPQMTLDRGPSGISSDYVWNFVVRVANELAKTHPDRKVFCGAYSTYRLPPLTIDKFPDNVWIQITNGRPIREMEDEFHRETTALRQEWLAKTNNPLSVTLNYTPFTNRGAFRPQYWPHVVARGIRESHEEVWREDVWLSSDKGGLHHPGMAHLNPYVISRFWWDADQDVDVLLAEYYEDFYGPAAGPMKTFIEHCEREYAHLASDAEVCRKALELFAEAKAAAPPESVYGQRIALVDEFLIQLRDRSTQMDVQRPEGLPEYRIIDMGKDKWRDVRDTLTLDGKLDDPFWIAYDNPRPLRDLHSSARKPEFGTRFHVRWMNQHLYFGIRCELPKGEMPVIGSREDNDPAIWQGEHLELLIETDKHSYYQIVINPAGAMIDIDRGVSKAQWYDWSSQAEVATHVGEDFWSAELKLPVTPSEEDPLHQIVGSQPFQSKREDLESGKGTSLPWYFNLYRKRGGDEKEETTSFSPLGADDETFHVPLRFAKIYVQ
ncbi:MAG: DUF4838 domain-containing protein [Verrucomicrobiae bacterium]|nr:DUF4838 domain-containing protein [Verrucomicrobiae bacterium]